MGSPENTAAPPVAAATSAAASATSAAESSAATSTSDTPTPTDAPRSQNLARSATIVSAATMTSRILGLLREQVLLIWFGAGTAMDAFNVAFRLPNLVRDLFAEGAMSAAFVPTFTRELKQNGRTSAWELGNLIISGLLVVTGIISLLGILFAQPLTHWIAANYASVPGKIELTTQLTQIMFPFLMFIAVAVAGMGMLNALRWFFIPALAPAMFNLATILSVFTLVPLAVWLGWHPMVGLAVGTLVGGFAQAALQWPALRKEGFRFRFQLKPRDPRVREVLLLMAPGTLGLAAAQINQLVNVWLATSQGEGVVTYLQLAFRLIYLPIGLFGVSIATAALPGIARQAAEENNEGIRAAVSQAMRMMLMLNVPATFGLIALAGPIIELLVEYGKVSAQDTSGMALAVICYAPGLVGYSAVKLLSPTFYSLRESRTPVLVSLVSIATAIALNLSLIHIPGLGFGGLALGTGIAALVNASLLLFLLRRRLGGIEGSRIATALVKILIASIVMAIAAWTIEHWLSILWPGAHAIRRLVRVMISVAGGLATLVIMAKLLRLHEFERALAGVLRRFKR